MAMDILSDYENMNDIVGCENINSIERELVNTINGSGNHNDTGAFSHPRGKTSQEHETRSNINENGAPSHDRILGSMETFSIEMLMRLSQEMDCFLSMMHSQINRVLSSADSRDSNYYGYLIFRTKGH